ncbi:hypothetical protein C5167_030412 [Papaver somniferum]|nr:hypothetical protein C5167_030412 [Papaver somniferum]
MEKRSSHLMYVPEESGVLDNGAYHRLSQRIDSVSVVVRIPLTNENLVAYGGPICSMWWLLRGMILVKTKQISILFHPMPFC